MQKLPPKYKEGIMKRVVAIAHGEWPKRERGHPLIPERYKEVMHVYLVQCRYRLVWSVDVKCSQLRREQCIKVWDVVTDNGVGRCIRRAESSLSAYTDEYVARCARRFSPPDERQSKYHPDVWATDIVLFHKPPKNSHGANLEHRAVQSSAVLMKFYPLSSATAKRLATSSGHIELPFVMSKEEESIVRSERSEFILGRSGTGAYKYYVARLSI
jgi:hypothetical protein